MPSVVHRSANTDVPSVADRFGTANLFWRCPQQVLAVLERLFVGKCFCLMATMGNTLCYQLNVQHIEKRPSNGPFSSSRLPEPQLQQHQDLRRYLASISREVSTGSQPHMCLLYCRDKKLIPTYESNFGQHSQQVCKETNARLQTITSKVAI